MIPRQKVVKKTTFHGPGTHQIDSKMDWITTPKLNLSGTFGVLHYSDTVPTVFGEALVGRPIGGSSNPGHGHGNTYRLTVMGTYTFSPTFLMDAHFGWARQGTSSEQPGLGKNIGLDVLGIPGTNGKRKFESGWPEFGGTDNRETRILVTLGYCSSLGSRSGRTGTRFLLAYSWITSARLFIHFSNSTLSSDSVR